MNYYEQIKEELINNEVYKKIKDYSKNKSDLKTYYNVGKMLNDAGKHYGEGIIKDYSKKLTKELGKGYTYTSLSRMRQFYSIFKNIAPVAQQLTWSNCVELLSIKDEPKRNYYINMCIENNLSKRELRNKIKSNEYERLGFIDKKNIKINDQITEVTELIKNPIILKNSIKEKVTEKILKQIILDDIEIFLKELGNGFCFIGSEYKIKIGNNYNYIDLLLFNIKFNCYIVIELKITEFKAEYIGQIKKYMNYIDKNIKDINHNDTIGIIISKKENKLVMEYVSDERIFNTTYELVNI